MLSPTLWDPKDCSPPGSSVHGVFQARIPEWVAIFSSRGSSQPRGQTLISCVSCRRILYPLSHLGTKQYIMYFNLKIRSDQSLSRVGCFATPWVTARQASLSITNSWSSLRLTSIESVMPSSHLDMFNCRVWLLNCQAWLKMAFKFAKTYRSNCPALKNSIILLYICLVFFFF